MSARKSIPSAKPRLERLENRELLTAGLLDPTFGAGGLVTTPPAGSAGSTVLMQPDGKIVVGTQSVMAMTATGFGPLEVLRYNANGTLDQAFGDHGKVLVPLASHGGVVDSLLLQPDGKIVVAAIDTGGSGLPTQALFRLTRSGQVDPTFGTHGMASEQIDGHSFIIAQVFGLTGGKLAAIVLIVKPDQQLLRFGTMHYTADGRPDPAFGDDGLVVFPNNYRNTQNGTILPDGKVVLAGIDLASPSTHKLNVSRFDADGSPDRTFAGSGSETIPTPGPIQDDWAVNDVTVQPDGKILLTSGRHGFSVLRLDANGTTDAGFGVGGVGGIAASAVGFLSLGRGSAVALQADGKILLAGDYNGLPTLVRLTVGGSPDASFGAGGIVVTAMAGAHSIDALAIQPDGKAVVVGSAATPLGEELAVARYQNTASTATTTSSTRLSTTPPLLGSPLTITATVTTALGVPTGSVSFFDGTTFVGAAAVTPGGTATATIYSTGIGTHHLTAYYSGDASRKPSSASANVVVHPGTTALSLSAVTRPGSATLTATVVSMPTFSIPLTGTFTFMEGNRVLGRVTLAPSIMPMLNNRASLTLSSLAPGRHTITARYAGDSNFGGSFSSVVVVI